MTSNGWITALTYWAMSSLSMDREDLIYEMPLNQLMLWARQDQYITNNTVMTLGDKDMIDKMNKQGGK